MLASRKGVCRRSKFSPNEKYKVRWSRVTPGKMSVRSRTLTSNPTLFGYPENVKMSSLFATQMSSVFELGPLPKKIENGNRATTLD